MPKYKQKTVAATTAGHEDIDYNAVMRDWDKLPTQKPHVNSIPQSAQNGKPFDPRQPLPPKSLVKWFADVKPRPVDFYWYPFLRRGGVNTVTGTQGTGKSLLICFIVSEAS